MWNILRQSLSSTIDERFVVKEGPEGFLVEDYLSGDDYSVEFDALDKKYLCIDNHDNTIEVWDKEPTIEKIITAINDWQ